MKRLVELLEHAPPEYQSGAKGIADYLLKNDVDVVKHGYNATAMHPVDEFVCSECGFDCEGFTEIVTDEDGEYQYQRECEFDYCPKCGAKIDRR